MAGGDDLEPALAALPSLPPWLPDAVVEQWHRHRRAVGRRHRTWRDGADSWDHLYEDQEHRRRALAGSLARELGELFEEAATLTVSESRLTDWMTRESETWIVTIRGFEVAIGDDEVGVAAYVEEFLARERRRVLERRQESPRRPVPAWRRLLARLRRGLRHAFFPGT